MMTLGVEKLVYETHKPSWPKRWLKKVTLGYNGYYLIKEITFVTRGKVRVGGMLHINGVRFTVVSIEKDFFEDYFHVVAKADHVTLKRPNKKDFSYVRIDVLHTWEDKRDVLYPLRPDEALHVV